MDAKPQILILEDNYLTAQALCDAVRDYGCDVAGPVGEVHQAFDLLHLRRVDGAIVDVNLHGNLSFPVCQELERKHVPFVFVTGSMESAIPPAFAKYKLLGKPVEPGALKIALAEIKQFNATRPKFGNALLDDLTQPTIDALKPQLQCVSLMRGPLPASSAPTQYAYFPTGGLITLFARDSRKRGLGVGLVGREGIVGTPEIMVQPNIEAVVEISSTAWRIRLEDLISLSDNHVDLKKRILGYVESLIRDIASTAIATGHATILQRLARWLLLAASCSGSSRLAMTHDHLSEVLAVRRSGITVALHELESLGAIRSYRQLVEIADHDRLQQATHAFV